MDNTSKIFRIFISSTFSDMVAERNALQERVFPKLRTLCASKGFQFQAIDLRWGVSEEAGLNQKAVSICMKEIERCQQTTKRPNFMLLMGNRYGWQPLPEKIPATEFVAIERYIANTKREMLNTWYWRDDNAVPAEYILQPRSGDFKDFTTWQTIEQTLLGAIRVAIEDLNWSAEQLIKYTTSVTEQEIIEGIFNNPNANDSAYCYFRKIENIPLDTDSSKYVEQNPLGLQKLDLLKNRLYEHLPNKIQEYSVSWSGNSITTTHIDQLCEDVELQLTKAILEEIDAFETMLPDEYEYLQHQRFMTERVQHFVGHSDILQTIQSYIDSDSADVFVLHGQSGIGKSTVMAKAVEQSLKANPVYRFIGITSETSNIASLLRSLTLEITQKYNSDLDISVVYADLIKTLPKVLSLATTQQPLVIFLDAIDQLSNSQSPENLGWLPPELPANVKIILSVIPSNYLTNLQKRLSIIFTELNALSPDDAEILIDTWLVNAGRILQPEQKAQVLNKYRQNGLAIYLKIAVEEAKLLHSYTPNFELSPTILGLIHDNLFARLSSPEQHGDLLVERAMSYLAASRYGLTESEMMDLLTRDDIYWQTFMEDAFHKPVGRQIPIVVWSRLEQSLRPYLSERGEYGSTTIEFYHRQFAEVVEQIYLKPHQKARHEHLSHYFATQDLFTGEIPNVRKISELPFQQVHAGLKDAYKHTLVDYTFIEVGLEVLGLEELINTFSLDEEIKAIKLIKSALVASSHILLVDETTLPYQFIGRLAYHQQSEISDLLDDLRVTCVLSPLNVSGWLEPAGGALLRVLRSFGGIRKVMQLENGNILSLNGIASMNLWQPDGTLIREVEWEWERDFSDFTQLNDGNILTWDEFGIDEMLRLWRPDDGSLIRTFDGHTGRINGVMQLNDGTILSWNKDKILQLWQPDDGSLINTLEGHTDHINGVIQLSDHNILSWSHDGMLRLWKSDGSYIGMFEGHTDHINGVIQLSDHNILSWSHDRTLRLWTPDGSLINTLEGLTDLIIDVMQLSNLKILSRGRDGPLQLWRSDVSLINTLEGHTDHISGVRQLNDGTILSWSKDKTLRLWQPDDVSLINTLEGHTDYVSGVRQLNDGTILSWSKDKTLRLWQPDDGSLIHTLEGHTDLIKGAKQLSDRNIVSWSDDKTLRLWQLDDGSLIETLEGHQSRVFGAFEVTSGNILSYSADGTLRLWQTYRSFLNMPEKHTDRVNGVIQLSDRNILSWSDDKTLRLWRPDDGSLIEALEGHTGRINGVMQLSNRNILSWSNDKTLRLWQSDGSLIETLEGHTGRINGVRQLSNHNILSWSDDKTLRLWQPDGSLVTTLEGHTKSIGSAIELKDGNILSISEDGKFRLWQSDGSFVKKLLGTYFKPFGVMELSNGNLLTWSRDCPLWLWSEDGSLIETLEGHTDSIFDAIELSNGNILSWSNDRTLRLWGSDGSPINALQGHRDHVSKAIELKDGKILSWCARRLMAHGPADRTLRLWGPDGTHIYTLEEHSDYVSDVRQLNDGNIIFWCSNGTLRLWQIDKLLLLELPNFMNGYITFCTFYDNDSRLVIGDNNGEMVFVSYQPKYLP